MYCKNCGTMLNATDKFCLNCGTPVEAVPTAPVEPVPSEPTVPVEPVPEVPVAPVPEMKVEENVTNGLPVGQPQNVPVMPQAPVMAPVEPTPVVPQAPMAPVQQMMMPPQGQPMPGVPMQPMMNPGMAPQKNNNKLGIIIAIIAVVAAVAVVAIFLITNNKNNEDKNGDPETGEKNPVEIDDPEEPVIDNSTQIITVGHARYNVPIDRYVEYSDSSAQYLVGNDYIGLSDVIEQSITDSTKDTMLSSLKANFDSEGYTVKSYEIKKYNGREYLYLNVDYLGSDTVYAYTIGTGQYTYMGIVMAISGNVSQSSVNEMLEALATAQYNSSATNTSTTSITTSLNIAL